MMWTPEAPDYKPVTYFKGYPIYVTTLLILVHIFTMVLIALAQTFNADEWLKYLVFDTRQLKQGFVWQVISYGFIHFISLEGLWFAVEMFLFFWFGREVEKMLGRKSYIQLYSLLWLVPPIVLLLGSFVFRMDTMIFGSSAIHLAMFVAFATIYPNAVFLFGLLAKWMVWIVMAIYTLIYMSSHVWNYLCLMWISAGVAYISVKSMGFAGGLDALENLKAKLRRRTRSRSDENIIRPSKFEKRESRASIETVNAILDKIATKGMNSLTDQEKETLEKARAELLRKDRRK